MKITLIAAVTIDGKLARDEVQFVGWTSKEDKKLFAAASRRAGVILVGHNTFKTFAQPLPGRLHIVLTAFPQAQVDRPGIVEYTNRPPLEIVAGLEARGYTEAVLVGGGLTNATFLRAGLVDEIWLTIEPLIFGSGIELFRGFDFDLRATLISMERLNEGGSILLKYSLRG